ncbi:MAG: transferrin-binding protein-like solute binding protein [Desulfurivibrionaceae bacterium]
MLTRNRITITMMSVSFIATMQTGIAWASVGQFNFTSGEVKVINRVGKARAGSKGGTIDEGETIITAPAASAQIKMIDGGIIAVRPDTQLRVDTYIFKGKEDSSEKGQVSLLRGGFRTITGAIGHINKNNYKIITPSATIGIRGTDHEPIFIPPALPGQPPVANAGTYDKVNVGVAYISTPLGSVNIQPNQVGYAAPDAMPQILPVVPNIYKQAPTPIQTKDEKEKAKEEGKKNGEQSAGAAKPGEEKKDAAATSEQKPTETAPAPVRTTAVVDPTTTISTGGIAVPVAAPAITNAPVLTTTMTDTAGTTLNTTNSTLTSASGVTTPIVSPIIPVQPYVQTDVAFEGSTNTYYGMFYYGYVSGGENSLTAAADIAPLANPPSFATSYHDSGGTYGVQLPGASGAVNGNATSFATTGIQFGRWTTVPTITQFMNNIPFAPGQNYSYKGLSWAFAPGGYLDSPAILSAASGGAVTGVFNYVLNGAPAPKDQNGVSGTLNSMSLAADFSTQTITAALNASLGTNTWNATTPSMSINNWTGGSTQGFSGPLTVTNTTNPTHNSFGSLNGAFTGQNYAGAIVGYNIYDSLVADSTIAISLSGIAALSRNGVPGNATVTNGTPAPTGKYVVGESGPGSSGPIYTTDAVTTSAGVLTGYYDGSNSYTITCTTCTGQAAPDTATGIRFGTWDEGTRSYTYTSPFGGQLSWIKGPGPDPIYLPEALLGTMTYALDGGTAPTNHNGQTGTLTSASLGVNFTKQTVDIALGLTGVNGHSWSVSSAGTPLGWSDYSKNGFVAYSALGVTVVPPGSLTVTMDGTTPGNGSISGQLTGSGLNGALFQYQLSAPLPMPVVPTTFTATDTFTAQAGSATVDWSSGSPVVTFPTDSTGTLTPVAATALNVTLNAAGQPINATVSGGVNATVATLTPTPSTTGSYGGLATTGEAVSVQTYGHLVTNSGVSSGLKYSNFGQWIVLPVPYNSPTATGPFTLGAFAGGTLLTPLTSMPTNNYPVNGYFNSNYSGSMTGGAQDSNNNTLYNLAGSVSLAANLSTGALTGGMNNIFVTNTTGSSAGYFNDLALATTIAGNGFSGTVTAGANPVPAWLSPINVPVGTQGTTSGHFYGPNANELTGIWALSSGTSNVAGAFGAANGTSSNPPTESVNGTVALVTATPADIATPYRLVALSGYDPTASSIVYYNNGMLTDGGFNNASRVIESAGNVTQFDSGLGNNSTNNSVTLALGTATPTNSGTDPVSGISWGRWQGGSIGITDRTTGTVSSASLGASSLHWIAGPTMTGPVALPTTGTYTYTLAGGTNPTDNLGNVGVLNSASLQADFAAQTVNVGVNVGINNALGATTLIASGANIPIQQRTMFDAHTNYLPSVNLLTATCSGAGCAGASPQAKISGAFTGPTGAGAGMTYGFVNGTNVVSGVAAFHR